MSAGEAGAIAAFYLLASSAGAFLGGALADRFGGRRIMMASLIDSMPFLTVAPAMSRWPLIVALAIGEPLLQSTLPINVTMAQTIAPISAATVSSFMMGFAWGVAGLSAPLVGIVSDHVGIELPLTTIASLSLAAAILAWPLPNDAPSGLRPSSN